MGYNPTAILIVGVPIKNLVTVEHKNERLPKYSQETGELLKGEYFTKEYYLHIKHNGEQLESSYKNNLDLITNQNYFKEYYPDNNYDCWEDVDYDTDNIYCFYDYDGNIEYVGKIILDVTDVEELPDIVLDVKQQLKLAFDYEGEINIISYLNQ